VGDAQQDKECDEGESAQSPRRGRQSQLWVRCADGWKIATAHVSEVDPEQLVSS